MTYSPGCPKISTFLRELGLVSCTMLAICVRVAILVEKQDQV